MKAINWNACRLYLLDYSRRTRREPYIHKRVSRSEVEPLLEAALRETMERLVRQQPSAGKTIGRR